MLLCLEIYRGLFIHSITGDVADTLYENEISSNGRSQSCDHRLATEGKAPWWALN